MVRLDVNGKAHDIDVEADTPLLWVLREQLGLTGTKYGCGIAQCGACTVHIDGAPVRSCVLPVSALRPGQKITTIEGLSADGSHPVQKAWVALDVPQCGYCQSGMIMAAAALLKDKPRPTDADIDEAHDQHLPLRHLQPRARGHQGGRLRGRPGHRRPGHRASWSRRPA
jgi:isoquinoline 1-oxidoreductase alpha subunit